MTTTYPDTTHPATAEASDFGWGPGYWPATVHHLGQVWYRKSVVRDPEGDMAYVRYMTVNGLSLLVWND
jgi:hypothetical protein